MVSNRVKQNWDLCLSISIDSVMSSPVVVDVSRFTDVVTCWKQINDFTQYSMIGSSSGQSLHI